MDAADVMDREGGGMRVVKDGGPAFPLGRVMTHEGEIDRFEAPGMSLRDWFAGQALGGVRAPSDYSSGPCNAAVAKRAYAIADAMLRARGEE